MATKREKLQQIQDFTKEALDNPSMPIGMFNIHILRFLEMLAEDVYSSDEKEIKNN